jgi:hypothetical protein
LDGCAIITSDLTMPENTLYYGDNLDVLRRYVRDNQRAVTST